MFLRRLAWLPALVLLVPACEGEPIEEEVLDPDSRVDVVFHLFPRGYDACHHVADSHIWGTVFARSSIVLMK